MEDDVVLADEVDQTRVLLLPPLLPGAPALGVALAEFLGIGDVADGSIEPDVEHLALGALHGHGDAPVEVARHGTWLQLHVEPALALAVNVGAPFLVALEDPLLQPALVLIQGQEPVGGVAQHELCATLLGAWVDELRGVEVASALLALVAVGLVVAVGTFADDVAVGLEGAGGLVVELFCGALDELAVVVELAEEVAGELMMGRRSGAAIYVEADAELLEAVLDHLVVAVHDLLGRDAFLAGALRDGHSMLVGATDEHHVLTLQAQVPYINICGHVHACEVPDVHAAIGVGQCGGDCCSLEFLFHILVLLLNILLFRPQR